MIEEPGFDQAAWSRFINTGDPSGLSYWTEVRDLYPPIVECQTGSVYRQGCQEKASEGRQNCQYS